MNDDERMRLAFQTEGDRWIGPTERERCTKHPRRWVLYRWEWHGERDDISGGEPVIVRGCGSCREDDANADRWADE